MLSLFSATGMAEKFRDDLFLIIKYVMENTLIFPVCSDLGSRGACRVLE